MRLLPAWGLGLLGSWWIARLQRSPESWARAAECTAPEARPLPAAEARGPLPALAALGRCAAHFQPASHCDAVRTVARRPFASRSHIAGSS